MTEPSGRGVRFSPTVMLILVVLALAVGVLSGVVALVASAPFFLAGFPITITIVGGVILFAYMRYRRRHDV